MARDPYQVIGVAKGASADDVKKAYRKRAKVLHPDQNRDDPKAQERFAELNNAYELLSDDAKRRQFDRGEIDAEGKPRFSGFEGFGGGQRGGGGFSGGFPGGDSFFEQFTRGRQGRPGPGHGPGDDFFDILSGMSGGRPGAAGGPFREPPADDITLTLKVPFLEAARGTTQRLVLPSGEALDLKIPAGTRDGHRMRLRGKGKAASLGRPSGDAYVVVSVEPHPAFLVEGHDVTLSLPIALDEAVLGAKVRVPTLDGEVELTLPPMTSSGKTFRLRGKGLEGKGDYLVRVSVVLPEASADLDGLARLLRERRRDDPRAGLP